MTEKMTGRKGLNLALGIVLLVSLIFAQDVSASRLREFSQLQYGGDLSINSTTLSIMTANISRMYFTADGLIGIGTITPSASLDVVGNISVPGTIFIDNESGRVGIGTTAPGHALAVIGDVNASNYYINGSSIFEILDNGTINRSLDLSNYYTQAEADAADSSTDTDLLGIVNTTMLDNKTVLRVTNINTIFDDFIPEFWELENFTASLDSYLSHFWELENFTSAYDTRGDRWDRENISDYLGGENISIFNLANYSAEYASSGFDRENISDYLGGENISIFNLANYSAEYAASGFDNENFTARYAAENISLWNRSGNDIFNADFDGNVGIGTISPSERLVVIGNISVPDTFFIDNESGRVGIGTASPGYTLDVIGDVNASNYYINGSSIFEILDNGTINRSLDLSNYYTKTEADTADDSGGDSDLLGIVNTTMLDNSTVVRMNITNVGNVNITGNFSVDTSDFFVDKTSGKVGVGNTEPSSTLEVEGNFTVSGQTNNTMGNFSIIQYNSTCSGFRFGITGGLILSCE